jgi:hypothetical protein
VIVGIASGDYLRKSNSPTGMEEWGGSGWARLGQYVPYLSEHYDVLVGTLWRKQIGTKMHLSVVDETTGREAIPDVLILQRLMHDSLAADIKEARRNGQFVIQDLDDWYWGLDTRNGAFHAAHPKTNAGHNIIHYKNSLIACDMLVCSTTYIADRVRTWGPPVVIHKNYVDTARFTVHEQTRQGKPTFGWAGSTAHRSGDLEILRGVLGPLSEIVQVHHSGDHEGSPKFYDRVGIPEDKVSTSPRVGAREYPSILNFDIGMIPLRSAPFNEAKSDIKGLEYAAAGIPFIASASGSYKELLESWGGDAFVVASKPEHWRKGATRLLPWDVREQAGQHLRQLVTDTRDIALGGPAYAELIGVLAAG